MQKLIRRQTLFVIFLFLLEICAGGALFFLLDHPSLELFIKDINAAFSYKAIKLKAIELATINCWKNASWAIERLQNNTYKQNNATKLPEQRIATAVSSDLAF